MTEQPRILAQGNDWLVIAKPAGWHTVRLPADPAESSGPTIEGWLRGCSLVASDLREAGLVQRLDAQTSGCVVCARSQAALERLAVSLRESLTDASKVYLALASGAIRSGVFGLYFTSRHRGSRKVTVRRTGRPEDWGRCAWRPVGDGAHGHSLLEVRIIGPGKRHQIRSGLAFCGHPLLGDVMYGGTPWGGRLALHSWRIRVEGIWVTAPLPEEWDVAAPHHD